MRTSLAKPRTSSIHKLRGRGFVNDQTIVGDNSTSNREARRRHQVPIMLGRWKTRGAKRLTQFGKDHTRISKRVATWTVYIVAILVRSVVTSILMIGVAAMALSQAQVHESRHFAHQLNLSWRERICIPRSKETGEFRSLTFESSSEAYGSGYCSREG